MAVRAFSTRPVLCSCPEIVAFSRQGVRFFDGLITPHRCPSRQVPSIGGLLVRLDISLLVIEVPVATQVC
jgi:hypothetical protein